MKRILLFSLLLTSAYTYAQTGIWGVTAAGGRYNGGAIFKTDGSGENLQLKKDLFRFDGEYPKANLLQASNGKLYGLTSDCCVFASYGVFFEYDPATKTYDKVFDFNDTINGSSPDGGLIEAKDGKLYGMTSKGGIYNWGVIFQYDPATRALKKLYDFDDTNGSGPLGNLIQASDGKFYGLTNTGGAADYGVLFQYDPSSNTYIKKVDFDGLANGGNPLGNLIQASNGKLYGLTSSGGKENSGVLFEYDPATSAYSKKIELNGASDGGLPFGSLVEAPDGNLYGLTSSGGVNNNGVLFQYIPATSTYTVKADFNGAVRGSSPQSSLTLATNGKLYGTAEYGGASEEGVIFEYDPATSVYSKKFEFDDGKITGKYPIAELTQATDGYLYGMAYIGGVAGTGVLFRFDPSSSAYTKEFDFHTSASGSMPVASLVQATDKSLYGIAQFGGIHNNGAIYQYDPASDTYTKKFDFEKKISGASPVGSLIQATDGKLYGTCMEGGAQNKGVLFQFDPVTNAYVVKVEFDGLNGNAPYGELMQANDGKIYGMTHEGGVTDNGVLFQFDPVTSAYSKKYDFNDDGNGKYPEGGLIQGDDGKLYGLASRGGNVTSPDFMDGMGALFQFDPATGSYSKKIDFAGTATGSTPCGNLTKTKDGKLFGLTSYGGITDSKHPLGCGILFQYDPSSVSVAGKFSFNGLENGSAPNGSLLFASDGNLYGVTRAGGKNDMGVLFQFDPLTFTYHKKTDFKHSTGKYAEHGKLIEVAVINSISKNSPLQMNMEVYPNPAKSNLYIKVDQVVTNATLKLITLSGQCVMEKNALNGNLFPLSIAELASGSYFVELQVNGSTSRLKLMKD